MFLATLSVLMLGSPRSGHAQATTQKTTSKATIPSDADAQKKNMQSYIDILRENVRQQKEEIMGSMMLLWRPWLRLPRYRRHFRIASIRERCLRCAREGAGRGRVAFKDSELSRCASHNPYRLVKPRDCSRQWVISEQEDQLQISVGDKEKVVGSPIPASDGFGPNQTGIEALITHTHM